MTEGTKDITSKLAILNAAYAAKLPDRIRLIENSANSLGTVASLAHKLGGSAGTHGFSALGQVAKNLESACQSLIEQDNNPTDNDLKKINGFITDLRRGLSAQIDDTLKQSNKDMERLVALETMTGVSPVMAENDIIVVDDDPEQTEMLEQLLINFGYSVTVVDHPSQLRQVINKKPPKAVIMDIVYSDGNDIGLSTTQALREEQILTCPVIFVSVRDDFNARLEAIRGGSSGYIVKPVNILELVELLKRLLEIDNKPTYRALLVDDDPDICEFCKQLLEDKGVKISVINDPTLAITTMANFKPDVIILDIDMPECNGFELSATIRQMGGEFLLLPIIYLTAHSELPNRMKAAQTGSEDFITKPINSSLLVTSVIARAERSQEMMELFHRMKANEQRFTSVTRFANEAIISANQHGLMLSWNQSVKTIFGYESQEILGQPVTLLIPEKYREAHSQGFTQAIENHAKKLLSKNMELEGLRKDGTVFPMDLSLSSWVFGNEMFFAATMRDITNRKNAEQKLLNAKLEAERANQAKSQFLSNMNHELRTPLNAVIGFSQLLLISKKTPLDDKQLESVTAILKGGRHLLKLINEILDLAKIEAGRVDLSIKKINLLAVILECLDVVSVLAEKRGIDIKLTNEGKTYDVHQKKLPIKTVLADQTRLKQVLINILSNAIKYNIQNGVIHMKTYEKSKGWVRISISDTGLGLTKKQMAGLFQPFNRLGAEQTETEGTGIGLVITQNLVKLMGGNIEVESEEGRGSTFHIDFVNDQSKEHGQNVPTLTDSPPDLCISASNKISSEEAEKEYSVLYIDDNPVNLRLIKKILYDQTKIKFYCAQEPILGLAMAKARLPSFILLETQLSDMDGFEILKKLRTDKITRNIPVVALSAKAMPSEIKKALAVGFNQYLTKPIDIELLLRIVRDYCK